MHISERSRRLQASGIRRMFDLASRLPDPIDFSIGQPDFEVPEAVQEAAIAAIRGGRNRYTITGGLPELNEAILDRIEQRTGVRPEDCMMTAGVAGGLTLAILALTDEHERILSPDPYFVCYQNLGLLLNQQEPAYYDTNPDFRVTEERLEAGMTEGVRALLVNTPGNPTGTVLSEEEAKTAAAFAKRHGLALISDEIYDAFTFDEPLHSPLTHHPETLLLGGFSKTFGVPGWRLGFAAGPREVVDRMRTIQQFTFVCAPSPAQHAALVALEKVDLEPYRRLYAHKRDLLLEALDGRFELVKPQGAFYAFPQAPKGMTGSGFAEKAIEKEVLVVPGNAFSQHDTHFRLSFATSEEKIREGGAILRALADDAS